MTKIHEFDPQIYPFKLWVAYKPTFAMLNKKFYFLNKDREIVETTEDELFQSNWAAQTLPVSLRTGNSGGLLVVLHKHKKTSINTITHEACHCTDYVAELLGFPERTFGNGEPYAYLCGWIAECISKVGYERSAPLYTKLKK